MNESIKKIIEDADAIVIGAGAGLSASAGLTYSGERFERHFSEFIKHYGFRDMYSAGFYPFETQEEKWAYWSHHIYFNRYAQGVLDVYKKLFDIVKDKKHFVLTTNVDHQFFLAGFDKKKVFATQGDYGLFQCSKPCHDTLYDNEDIVREMRLKQKNFKIPRELVPKCPVCGENMEHNLRGDDTFVQDENWDIAHGNYQEFIRINQKKEIVFIELGVGMNTPGIIKYPFWKLTHQLEDAKYICINKGEAYVPNEIKSKAITIDADIGEVLMSL